MLGQLENLCKTLRLVSWAQNQKTLIIWRIFIAIAIILHKNGAKNAHLSLRLQHGW